VSKQLEIVGSESQKRAESAANDRVREYEGDGYDLVDQEIAVGSDGVTILLVFESGE